MNIQLSSSAGSVFPLVMNFLVHFLLLWLRFSLHVSQSFSLSCLHSPALNLLIYLCFFFSLTVFAPQASLLLGTIMSQCLSLNAYVRAQLQIEWTKELSSFAEAMHNSWPPPVFHLPLHMSFPCNDSLFCSSVKKYFKDLKYNFIFITFLFNRSLHELQDYCSG